MKSLKNYLVAGLIGFGSFNFSLGQSNSSTLQYPENARYSDSRISYKIENCSIETKANILKAIRLLKEKTILDFYEVNTNEKITFTFRDVYQDAAGTGGGDNISKVGQFYIINHGVVTLKKSEDCFTVVLHELLHALGFAHSNIPNDIMYESYEGYTECYKPLGEDIPKLINKLYSIPITYQSGLVLSKLHQADLVLSKVIPKREDDNYIFLEIEIKNSGLKKSEKSAFNIYLNNKIIRTINIEELNAGSINIMKFNTELKKNTPGKLKMIIENNFEELDKKNNEKIFNISQIK